MNEKQLSSLNNLLDIKCRIAEENDVKNCSGPWCTARKNIAEAFEIVRGEEEETEAVEEFVEDQEED